MADVSENTVSAGSSSKVLSPFGYEVTQIELFNLSLTQTSPIDSPETEGAVVFEGSLYIAPLSFEYGVVFIMASFIAKREPAKNLGATTQASYFCVMNIEDHLKNEQDRILLAEHVTRNHIWNKFRDLLGYVVIQGNLTIPKPPIRLDALTITSTPPVSK